MKKRLHIVSFDVPYPPNYGGIIDVFYKIVELHKLNIEIYLHIYHSNKKKERELNKYCKEVFYYKRNSPFLSLISILPYRVKSRSSKELFNNLNAIKAPILFEGLHTAYLLNTNTFRNTYIRAHNIEHRYFFGIAKSERNIFKKIFFYIEALKLKRFEKSLKQVTRIFSISPFEQHYFLNKYGKKSIYIPAFHEAKKIQNHSSSKNFILYHGDLRTSDNSKVALFLINVYKNSPYKLIIASSHIKKSIISKINRYTNIEFRNISEQEELVKLFKEAHINTLFSFQKTGIKLKLLNTLYLGKFIIANTNMIEDTGLENLCELANTKEELLKKTALLFLRNYDQKETRKRQQKLLMFKPLHSAKKMIDSIFKN